MPTYQGLFYFVYRAMEGMLQAWNAIKESKPKFIGEFKHPLGTI
jgi:hypothetical protein